VVHRTLVSTELLASHLDGWTVVDCRFDLQNPDWGREQYLAAHVPGSVYAHLNDDLSAPPTGSSGRHPLPSADALASTFGRLGIDRSHQVVVYDQDAGMYASRCWWLLRYLGHDAVALLDGGWAKWLREGRPVRAGVEPRPPAAFTPQVQTHMLLRVDDVAARLGDTSMLLVDARAPERFEGRSEPLDRVAGHIPGAAHHFFKWNVGPDGTMLPQESLRDAWVDLTGGRPPDEVVMYCGSGVTACHNLLAMEHAGLPGARLYAGSWSEWSSDPARPVETGPPRTRK
jgi:thiosulfate/3-mercaptopyruvate sulfurtransferase